MGIGFGFKTLYCIALSSLAMEIVSGMTFLHCIPGEFFYVRETLLIPVIAGVLEALGIGLVIRHGGSTGGTDIIALIVSKYYNISPGKVILYLDIFIVGSSFFVSHKIENVVFGYIVMVTMTYVLDMVLDGNKQSYQIMIFSPKNKEIGEAITTEVGRGATLLDAEGCYSHQNQQVLIVMVHKTDKPHVMQIIHRIDGNAFISVTKTTGVYGRNFEKLKL
jgi:uncharacterized membrane-anchored protein YitT (DUF2179 family)